MQNGKKSNACPQRRLVNVAECEDEECRETKLYPDECFEPNGESEYEDDDG